MTRKPIFIMSDSGVDNTERQAVRDGINELLETAGVNLEIRDFGAWRCNPYKNIDGSLKDYCSVDWYVEEARRSARAKGRNFQIDAQAMVYRAAFEPWQDPPQGQPHYDVIVVSEDMFAEDTNFVVGIALPGLGTVISTNRYKGLDDSMRYKCVLVETLHEVGHVFGLPNTDRTDLEMSLGHHCQNTCVMRQGLVVPPDWINIVRDRDATGRSLCNRCEQDLKAYFRNPARRV